jgi:GTP cyclohydrolase IA
MDNGHFLPFFCIVVETNIADGNRISITRSSHQQTQAEFSRSRTASSTAIPTNSNMAETEETMTIVSNSPSVPSSEDGASTLEQLETTLTTTDDVAATSTTAVAAATASANTTVAAASSTNKRARLLGGDDVDDDDNDDDTDSRLKKMQNNKERQEKVQKMAFACRTILECMGEDPTREGLQKTPERWAKALLFMTSGYAISPEQVTNHAVFCENHHEMVVVRNIDIHSLCEHHMLPFTGRVHIGYIPNGKVIGLSKLARIAELYARRLQVQERLTSQIADAVLETVQPLGVAVVVECTHFCMVMRGVQKTGAVTTTSSVRGCFETNSKTRAEFFSILHGSTRIEMR